jgi:hypothetical protein
MPDEHNSHEEHHVHTDTLLEWKAAARPFKKRDQSFFLNIAALAFLIIVILFFMREFLIIGTALAVVFVAYTLVAVPPPIISYKITEKGIWIDEVFYRFSELSEYWFEAHLESVVLVATLPQRKIGRILLVVPFEKRNEIDDLLRSRLVFREKPLKTTIDRFADFLKSKVPLEEEKHPHSSEGRV